MKRIIWSILGVCLMISACSDTKKIAPKEGRIAVISEKEILKSTEKIRVDTPQNIVNWTAPNTNARNKIPAVSLKKTTPAWKVGGAKGKEKLDLPAPVIIQDKIYTLDSTSQLIARNTKDGEKLWQVNLEEKKEGIGLTADKKHIIILDENGTVAAFDTNGKMLWKKEFKTGFRNTPLLTDNSLYLLSFDNNFWALNVKTGTEKWHYKTASTQTLLRGMGRPALFDHIIIVPFSTGEVVAFNAESGVLLWSQDLIGKKMFDAVASLAQMSASPVIESGIVYLVGHGEQTMAANLKTGESLWQLARGGQTTPLLSGNALFFVDNKNHLLALNKKSGKLFWETALEKGIWKGPYLLDEKLVLFSEEKSALVDIKDGKINYTETRIEGSLPSITDNGIFFLGNNGKLYHWEKI